MMTPQFMSGSSVAPAMITPIIPAMITPVEPKPAIMTPEFTFSFVVGSMHGSVLSVKPAMMTPAFTEVVERVNAVAKNVVVIQPLSVFIFLSPLFYFYRLRRGLFQSTCHAKVFPTVARNSMILSSLTELRPLCTKCRYLVPIAYRRNIVFGHLNNYHHFSS
jgi:hypothetical protein